MTIGLLIGLSMPPSSSLYKKVGAASLIMMASIFLSRVIGLFREMAIAYVGGTSAGVDAYQVAFVIPEILNHIAASGFLSITFIPIFSRYLAHDREQEGWRVFSIILNTFGAMLSLLITVAFVLAPALVALVAPGLQDPDTVQRAVHMTRIILPAQFFFFSGGLFMAVQFAKERFFIPALAPLIYNLGIITGGLVLGPRLGMEGFSWGVLGGALIGNFAVQLLGARRVGMRYRLALNLRHPDLIKYILLSLPLMIGLGMAFSSEFFIKFFGSYLPPGSIASLNYGLRVMLILVGLFGQSVGTASYPFMARLAAEKKLAEMNHLLNTGLRYLLVVIPFSVLLMVLRHEVILILFQRGRFDAAATALTARLLVFLLIGTFAFSAAIFVNRGYYAVQNTLFPAVFGSLAVIVSIPLYLVAMRHMGAAGLALAISLSSIFQVTLLYILWNRKSVNRGSREVYFFFVRVALASTLMGIILEAFHKVVLADMDRSTFSGCLVSALYTSTLFAILLIGAAQLFGIREIPEMIRRIIEKLAALKSPKG